jgi:ligand-binding sensor domain-containing protein
LTASKIIRVLLAVLIAMWVVACEDDKIVDPPPLPPQLSLELYNDGNGLPSNDVFDILVDSQGRTWFATQLGLGLLENGTMRTINQADGLIHPNTRAVVEFKGKMYIATWGGGVAVYAGAAWSTLTVANGLVSGSVMSIAVDDTSLYFATPVGVSQYNPTSGLFKRFTVLEKKNRWTATKKGILEFVETSSVLALVTPRGPEIWFGALYGFITVWRPQINDFITYSKSNSSIPGHLINVLHYNGVDGMIWVGTATSGIASVDVPNSTWTRYDAVDGLPSSVVYSITSDQAGRMWVGTSEGVAKQDGNGFIGYGRASGLPEERVRKVYVDSQNRVWLGFIEGGAALIK